MLKRSLACLTVVCVFAGGSFASPASEAGVSRSPLKVYSYGLSAGAMYSLNNEFKEEAGDVFMRATFINAWEITDNVALFGDLSWYYGGSKDYGENESKHVHGFGLDLGFDYYIATGGLKPFIGAGLGVQWIDRPATDDFGEKFGMSLTAHLGIALDITETAQVRFRVPFHAALRENVDMGIGAEVGVMFYNKFRNVKKLNY